jgi:hypothetical protein
MRLQVFSPALAFTSTTLRTPTNNNNKVASVSAPTSSQRQGFDDLTYNAIMTMLEKIKRGTPFKQHCDP